jgi:glycosyltransferase involved in cell wall biosynthesis
MPAAEKLFYSVRPWCRVVHWCCSGPFGYRSNQSFCDSNFRRVTSQADEFVNACAKGQVLFLNRSYWPDLEATGQLLTDLTADLSDRFEVTVACGQPNSINQAAVQSEWQALAQHNGVHIRRIQHFAASKSSLVSRMRGFLSFCRNLRKELTQLAAPDVCVFQTDPFLLPFEAERLRRRTGCRLVAYLQDIFPDVAIAAGITRDNVFCRILRRRLFSIYRHCDRVIVLSSDMKDLLVAGGVAVEKIAIVRNWADTSVLRPVGRSEQFRQQHGLGDRFCVMYSGNIGRTQGLSVFVEAAEILRDRKDLVFTVVGRGADLPVLKAAVAEKKLTNVVFLDYQPRHLLSESLSAADLHWLPFSHKMIRCLMPSKFYGILSAGGCCLSNAAGGSELHREITENGVGLTVAEATGHAIAERIGWAMDHVEELEVMRVKARRLAEEKYDRSHSIAAFERVLSALVSEDRVAQDMTGGMKE